MADQENSSQRNPATGKQYDKGRGMQGIDKAPGEETAQTTENPVTQTQKAKNKVDGDPSQESDRPEPQR